MCGNTQMKSFLTCNEFYCPHTHGLPASGDCGTRRIAPASACCGTSLRRVLPLHDPILQGSRVRFWVNKFEFPAAAFGTVIA